MIKYLILFIHLVGFTFFQWLTGDISVQQKMPENINPGSSAQVEITINKNGVGGFAKYQQTLPQGFSAEVVDAKGATFSFKDNVLKFIWMALPAEEQFVISYKLTAANDLSGDFDIAGKFSYIADNERKNIEVEPSKVSVSEQVMANVVEEEPVEETVEEPIVEEEVEEQPVAEVVEETEQPSEEVVDEEKSATVGVEIAAERLVENSGEFYTVTTKISQKNLEGFSKLVDQLPNGFTAEAIKTNGGVFSFKNNEAKILWMASPKEEEFEVAYKVIPNGADLKDYDLNGIFSYLENDVTQQKILNATTFTHNIEPVSEESVAEVVEEVIEEKPVEEIAVVEEPVIEEPIEEVKEEVIEEPQPLAEEVTTTPAPQTGIAYKVQVGAGHNSVSSNYFRNKFNLTDKVSTEAHEGWIKYVVGKFDVYKDARDKRNAVRNNVSRAFVTAYNEGKRITVQEALMISNQEWVK